MQLAQINFDDLEAASGNKFAGGNIGDIINDAVPYIFAFAGVLLFIYLIAGGFSYMTSGGDPKKTSAAQGQLTNGIIGLLIVLLAFLLVQVVGKIFGLEAFGTIFNN